MALWQIDFLFQSCTLINFACSVLTKFYQHILALAFAVKEINENPKFCPNITLGFHIYDSYYDARMTYRTTLDLLFKSHRFVPNYKCDTQKNLIAIIGGLSADTSFYMADTIGLYKIPQDFKGVGAFRSSKVLFPSQFIHKISHSSKNFFRE
uniref:vomeronasal type-2 receptor 26-like n=1 Tax=Podarcis muralis TaxID=64176 RepID=UPI00109F9C4F|nr:vomeronasal type-2 receptor 26-like [Podarcis muralis]